MKKIKLCLMVTDASSFNTLYRGQFEWLEQNSEVEVDLTLLCGGEKSDVKKLVDRNVGKVVDVGLSRRPAPIKDLICLFRMFYFLCRNRYDVVVYSTPKAFLIGSIASFFSFHSNRVGLVHGRVYENFRGLSRSIWTFLDRLVCLLSTHVLFVSTSLKKAYLDEGIVKASKSLVLGSGSANGVSGIQFDPRRRVSAQVELLRKKHGFLEEDFIVLCVGRICIDKGSREVAEVIRRNSSKKVKFLILGDFEDAESKAVFSSVSSEGFSFCRENFTDEVADFFALSNLHLFLSHREGFGNVAIEAAASNVPTVAFDVVGVKDSVFHGVSGMRFEFGDVEAITEFIQDCADGRNCLGRFSGARIWALSNYEHSMVWRNYLNFYASLVRD